jgi:hypothetical protein
VVGVGVVEAVDVPAAVGREVGDGVDALLDQRPEVLGRTDATRVAAAHADDDDRVAVDGGGRGDLFGDGGLAGELAEQEGGQLGRGRVVEGQCGGQP